MSMIASAVETFAVILIVAAAAGYLGLRLRRSVKGSGGCYCGQGRPCSPSPGEDEQSVNPDAQQFIPSKNIEDWARRHARDQRSANEQASP